MRITACLLAFLCAGTALVAQMEIPWSPARKLTKDDFKARVPLNAPSASMSWIHVETEWECKDGTLVATALAMFDPSRSWWRNTRGSVWGTAGERTSSAEAQLEARRNMVQLDLQLLEHEQLHFDIAEVTVRKIRARFQDFKNACARGGRDGSDSTDDRARPIASCRTSSSAMIARPATASTLAHRTSGDGGYTRC